MNNQQQFSSQADNQNQALDYAEAIKLQAARDIQYIENLVQTGQMTYENGLDLMNFVSKKAFEMYTKQKSQVQSEQASQKQTFKLDEIPEFFNRDGRSDVFEYLKNADTDFDDDEISKISDLVEKIEKTAIERYLREQEHEKTLNSENESAKQRLRANAQNANSESGNNLVYTREQIGKMSGAEFAKHERAIMDQLKKGLIR